MLKKVCSILRLRWLVIILCSVCALEAGVGVAQTPDTAALRGEVTGPNGAGFAGVRVTIEDSQQRTVREVRSGSQGEFIADDLPPGISLVITANYAGFGEARSEGIVLAAGSTATLQLSMRVATASARRCHEPVAPARELQFSAQFEF